MTLPGNPPPTIVETYRGLTDSRYKQAFEDHLLGGTSANWLASTMREAGFRLAATTIKDYRRALRAEGVIV